MHGDATAISTASERQLMCAGSVFDGSDQSGTESSARRIQARQRRKSFKPMTTIIYSTPSFDPSNSRSRRPKSVSQVRSSDCRVSVYILRLIGCRRSVIPAVPDANGVPTLEIGAVERPSAKEELWSSKSANSGYLSVSSLSRRRHVSCDQSQQRRKRAGITRRWFDVGTALTSIVLASLCSMLPSSL